MKKLSSENIILNNVDVEKKIERISLQILEDNINEEKIVIFGISDNGVIIAKKIIEHLNEISKLQSSLCKVINDNSIKYDQKFDITDTSILIIDDVSQSGKTLQSVISDLFNFNPKRIKTAVIVNRDHSLFPVKIDYSGISLSTSVNEHVEFTIDADAKMTVYLN